MAFASLAALGALAACTDATAGAPNATPSPAQSVVAYGTTNAEPADCVRKSESFRYYDWRSHQTLPRIEKFASYPLPDPSIRFYLDTAGGKNVAIELPPRGKSPHGPAYRAIPLTPIIVGSLWYAKRDRATVVVLPSGSLADEYEWYVKRHADQAQAAERASDALFAGASPSPSPTNAAEDAHDRTFTANGLPAVTALQRGAGPDDRFFRDVELPNGEKYNDLDPHARLFTCNYLENRPYDLVLTLVRKRRLAEPQYGELQAHLKEQKTPDNLIDDAGYVAYEQDVLVAHGVNPQLWAPDKSKKLDDADVRTHALALPFEALAQVELPTPDATLRP